MLKTVMRGFVSALLALLFYIVVDVTLLCLNLIPRFAHVVQLIQLARDEGERGPCPLSLLETVRWLENVMFPMLAALLAGATVSFWSKIGNKEMVFHSFVFGLLLAITFGGFGELSWWVGVILSHFVFVGGVVSCRSAVSYLKAAEWKVRGWLG